jgi:hypothetical protein
MACTENAPLEASNARTLCTYCGHLSLQDLRSIEGYDHQPTYSLLCRSASTCPLCCLIRDSVERTLSRLRAFAPFMKDDLGPVRMHCAGRSLGECSKLHYSPGPVEEMPLWREVAVTIGKDLDRTRCFSSFGTQILMLAAQGESLQSLIYQALPYHAKVLLQRQPVYMPYGLKIA